MNLEEYERSGLSRYERLADIIAQLLERGITGKGGIRLEHIQRRAKSVESLSRRLEEDGQLGTDQIELHRKDLAGCRIVLYTNSDVNRFTYSGLLGELFDIDWNRSRIHEPGPSEESVPQLFQSSNYVVKLKPDRTGLLEYREFEGLYCEVQMQTTLNHAWAEMAHDTIYKRPELQGFGARQLEKIEERLGDAMRKHLRPAGYLFQRIAADVQRLAEGKELFDAGALDAVLAAEDNNERYQALVRLRDRVLPYYDDLEGLFPEVCNKLRRAWLNTVGTETVPHETPFGDIRGFESLQVTGRIAGIIEWCRYLDPEETYAFVRDLYTQTADAESRNQLVKVAERLARPTLQVWEQRGALVQVLLAELLSEEKDIVSIGPLATAIASQILEPEIEGTTMGSTTMTFRRGAVVHDSGLEKARRMVIEVIAGYAESVTGDDNALKGAIGSLFDSGRRPLNCEESPETAAMILSDLAYAVERMVGLVPEVSFDARQYIESQLLHYWRLNGSLPEHLSSVEVVVEAHEQLVKNMNMLREALNADEEFLVSKTIVGYKSVFAHQWDDSRLDYKRDEVVRNQLQDERADSITPKNWSTWKSRLATAVKAKSEDGATFLPFQRFLAAIAERQPKLAFELLSDRSVLPDWTICPIAKALLEGELRSDVMSLLYQWLDEGRCVREIAGLTVSGANVDAPLILKVAKRAVDDRDVPACTELVWGAIRRYANDPEFWRDEIFFLCLGVLQQAEGYAWIARSWHERGEGSLFGNLTADQSRAVLDAMVNVTSISYQAEQILKSIAATRPQMVLDWFGQRVNVAAQNTSREFRMFPFSFQSVHEALQPHPLNVIAFVRKWHGRDDEYGKWEASRFLSLIYPNFEEPLSSTLLNLVEGADADDLAFLASSLGGFKGRAELLPVLRAILASDAANGEVESVVSRVLLETGVTSGEFGQAQAYQGKADQLRPWLEDGNDRVAKFAAREMHTFQMTANSENRRTREIIALRKLHYGEPLEIDDVSEESGAGADRD